MMKVVVSPRQCLRNRLFPSAAGYDSFHIMNDPEFNEVPAYEPSPLDMSGLERTSIGVPPRLLEDAFGYSGDRRYVSFHWSPRHSKLFLCDGLLRVQLSDSPVWPRFLAHPLIAPHMQQFTADHKRVEALEFFGRAVPLTQAPLFSEDDAGRMDADVVTSCLLLDRREADVYAGPWSGALNFHSLVGDEVFEGEASEASDESAGNPEERLISWLNEHYDDPDELFAVAATFHRFKQHQQALDTLLRCVRLRPESDGFHLRLSQTYVALDRWEEALTVCEKAVRLQAGAVKRNVTPQAIFTWLGRCQFELKRYAEAADTYQLVVQIDPHLKGVEAYHQLGRCFTKLGRHKEAIGAHQNAVRLQAEEAALSLFSMVESDAGEYGPDLAEMDRGRIGDSLEELGKAHMLAGQFHEGETALRQALKANPNSIRAQGCLALIHDIMDKRRIAAEEFKIAAARARLMIEHRPDNASAHGDLAFVYRAMGDDSAANEAYQRAVELGWRTDPDADLFTGAVRLPDASGAGQILGENP
jgi:tetratricopeptide (TPR) repeat protein